MWDSDTNFPKRSGPGFPLLDLRAFIGDRDSGSWARTEYVGDGLSQRMGPSLHRSNNPNSSGPLR